MFCLSDCNSICNTCVMFYWTMSSWKLTVFPHFLQGCFNTLRPRRSEQHFADDIFKRIFFNENVWISIKISLRFVPKGPINNIPALVQIMAWRRPGDKPLSEPMMVSLTTHICVTRPQWVNSTGATIWRCLIVLASVNQLRSREGDWHHRNRSTLVQVMACCQMAASHYLNQCWKMC